jgi:hypothetical protein
MDWQGETRLRKADSTELVKVYVAAVCCLCKIGARARQNEARAAVRLMPLRTCYAFQELYCEPRLSEPSRRVSLY